MILGGSPLASVLVLTQRVRQLLAHAAALFAMEAGNTYRPEAHYMRGPGPKWREKHARADH
jgi:hypothetical protein